MDGAPFASPAVQHPKPHLLLAIAQWVVAAFLAFIVVRSLLQINEAKAVSVTVWPSLAFVAGAAAVHMPPVFFRASLMGRYGLYAGAAVALLILGLHEYQFKPATSGWTPTPALGADSSYTPAAGEGPAYAGPKASEPLMSCSGIIPSIISMSEDDGPEVFEINDVTTLSTGPDLRCSGLAHTSRGERRIKYGAETTPQGRVILNLEF